MQPTVHPRRVTKDLLTIKGTSLFSLAERRSIRKLGHWL
jgi:hypothetical protein